MKKVIKKFKAPEDGSVYLEKEKDWVYLTAESFGTPDPYMSILMTSKQWKAIIKSECKSMFISSKRKL